MRKYIRLTIQAAAVAAAVLIFAGCGTVTTLRDGGAQNNTAVNVDDKQTAADEYAKQCYMVTAEYLAEQFTLGRHNDIVLEEGDLADAVSADGLSFNKEQYAQGEQYLFDNLSKIDIGILDGTVFITFDVIEGSNEYDFNVRWVSVNGETGEYPKQTYTEDIDPELAEEATQEDADRTAKMYYALTAEYIADQETIGRTLEEVVEAGEFSQALSDEGLEVFANHSSSGDAYICDPIDPYHIRKFGGTVYLTFNSLETYNGYDMTVIWESPNGVVGSYHNDSVVYEQDDPEQTDDIEDTEELEDTEDTENNDGRVTLSQANKNAKIFFNSLAEYLADEYTMGRDYPTVLAEGDLALTTSPEGMPLDGEITAKGDSYLAQLVSVYDADMRHARVYAGFDVIEGEDEFDFFVQWMSEDGVIGQYPTPVREEDRDEVVFGTFYDR